jgi:hypothetical protein
MNRFWMRYDAYVRVPLLVVPRTASGIGAPGGGGGGRKKLARGKRMMESATAGGCGAGTRAILLYTILQPILVSQNYPK